MAATPASGARQGIIAGFVRRSLTPARERLESNLAAALNGVMRRTGLHVEIQQPPAPPQVPHPVPAPAPPAPARAPPPPRAAAPAGPTPVQVMSAVQSAVVGAVNMVSGVGASIGAARDAARAASKTASGAATVASGVATVATGFFPKLTALGLGPKAPRNRPGRPPQRRVADIIANPMGRGAPTGAAPSHPTRRIERIPMVRPRSSLELSRKDQARKPRSYADLQMRPQLGLSPHEILLKVATLTLGKTLIGFLEAGARSQQKALQRVNDRMSQRQIMLLGMLPAQFIVERLPQPQVPAPAPAAPSPAAADPPAAAPAAGPAGSPRGAFKLRY